MSGNLLAAVAAEYDLDFAPFNRGRQSEAYCWQEASVYPRRRRWRGARLATRAMMEAAATASLRKWAAAGGPTHLTLPWNLVTHGPWVPFSRHHLFGAEDSTHLMGLARRLGGWLQEAAEGFGRGEYALVKKLLCRALGRGMTSRRTSLDVWRMLERFRSPGQLNRWLARVARRADRMLGGARIRVSWLALGEAVSQGDLRVNRAAARAALFTLRNRIDRVHHVGVDVPPRARDQRRLVAMIVVADPSRPTAELLGRFFGVEVGTTTPDAEWQAHHYAAPVQGELLGHGPVYLGRTTFGWDVVSRQGRRLWSAEARLSVGGLAQHETWARAAYEQGVRAARWARLLRRDQRAKEAVAGGRGTLEDVLRAGSDGGRDPLAARALVDWLIDEGREAEADLLRSALR